MLTVTLLPPTSSLHFYPSAHHRSRLKPLLSTAPAPATISIPSSVETKSEPSTLYQVLRVNYTASPSEIKAAYRSLAKLYHPDATSSDPNGECFIEIHNAYATLSDPVARANYDLSIGAKSAHCCFRYSLSNNPPGFWPTRRWETDQCW